MVKMVKLLLYIVYNYKNKDKNYNNNKRVAPRLPVFSEILGT